MGSGQQGILDWRGKQAGERPSPIRNLPSASKTSLLTTDRIPASVLLKRVMEEVSNRIQVCDHEQFLDKILPVDGGAVDKIYRLLLEDKTYDDGHWCGFPQHGAGFKEDDLYEPFVSVANKIAAAARHDGEDEEQVRDASWVDYHHMSPRYLNAEGAKVRPDCLLALGALAKVVGNGSALAEDKKEELFWLQAVAAVEAKREIRVKDEELILQLLCYLRMILVEQKDRRFALGLALSRTQISVWLQDRSGVLGMNKAIDIHTEPKKFIQVIAAFSLLPAHRLGFDPTMRLAREPSAPIHPYRLCSTGPDQFDVELYKRNNYSTQWVIETKNGVYVTLKALSLLRTDVVHGSGSIVWAVFLYDERHMDPGQRQIFVLKQAWRLEGMANEGELYRSLWTAQEASASEDVQYLGELVHDEDVTIDGAVDNTHNLIHRGLEPIPPMFEDSDHLARLKRRRSFDPEFELVHIDIVTDKIHQIHAGRSTSTPENRTRTRIVLKTFGCSVKFFANNTELVRILLHGVRAHRFAYQHGVLHRDISTGNVLIALKRGPIKPVSEREIPFKAPEPDMVELTRICLGREIKNRCNNLDISSITDTMIEYALHAVAEGSQAKRIDPESMQLAYCGAKYVVAAYKYTEKFSTFAGGACDLATFGWNGKILGEYFLDGTMREQVARAPRSGTPPYASVMLLNAIDVIVNVHKSGLNRRSVIHDAVHDMESFFWILLYLCLTRLGPGGSRRKELKVDIEEMSDSDERTRIVRLRRIVFSFFDGDIATLAWNKRQLLEEWTAFESEILIHVHEYFAPLKPVLLQWWHLLLLAYEFHGYEYHNIHDHVIALLEKALDDLGNQVPMEPSERTAEAEAEAEALKKREDFVRRVVYAGLDPPAVGGSDVQRPATPPRSPKDFKSSTVLDVSPESQRQPLRSQLADNAPSSPTPARPASKKTKLETKLERKT
ncbi:hypothetical protein BD414DRAFT_582045 [Trametes punicea]|nr:hypothetical protein BD414DRAFT_582045 [Trametes punicea]